MTEYTSSYKSPSNIALVKYWGKKDVQIPRNASISFTLSECVSQTTVKAIKSDHGDTSFKVWLDGNEKQDFVPKIETFWSRVKHVFPSLEGYQFEIHTSNTFPHSSGIASSASGMSALALCFADIQAQMTGTELPSSEVSEVARLGSGSACRSLFGPLGEWGEHEDFEGSSDLFAIPITNVHEIFTTFNDTILIVHKGQKTVSSTVGHNLLDRHPFADNRYKLATENMSDIKRILREGDLKGFVQLVEAEALMLHALMMTSDPNFILMEPNTLAIIKAIRSFRDNTGIQVCFTLDAGANVHMLYPDQNKVRILQFVEEELKQFCAEGYYICDKVGNGPTKLNP